MSTQLGSEVTMKTGHEPVVMPCTGIENNVDVDVADEACDKQLLTAGFVDTTTRCDRVPAARVGGHCVRLLPSDGKQLNSLGGNDGSVAIGNVVTRAACIIPTLDVPTRPQCAVDRFSGRSQMSSAAGRFDVVMATTVTSLSRGLMTSSRQLSSRRTSPD